MFGGVAIGVRKQAEADMAIPMTRGRGEIPLLRAIGIARGAISAAVAVLDIKFVTSAVTAHITASNPYGLET